MGGKKKKKKKRGELNWKTPIYQLARSLLRNATQRNNQEEEEEEEENNAGRTISNHFPSYSTEKREIPFLLFLLGSFFHFLSFSFRRRRRRATLFFFPTFILSLSNLFEKYAPAFTPLFYILLLLLWGKFISTTTTTLQVAAVAAAAVHQPMGNLI